MRARGVVATATVLLVLAAAAVAAEVVVRARTQRVVADTVAAALGADPATTSVTLGGGLVLPQLVRGRLDEVDVVAPTVVLGHARFADVTAHATGVTVDAPYTAATLTATGVVPPDTLREQLAARGLGLDVAADEAGSGGGAGTLRASGSLLGVGWGLTLAPRVAAGHLLVDVVTADVAGAPVRLDALPSAVRGAVTGLEVPLTGLPAGLAPTAAHVVPGGVAVTLEGTDVRLGAAG